MDQNLAAMEDEIRFDRRLKEQYMTKDNLEAKEAQMFQKNWLSKFKNIALLFYYIVIPFVQTPDWCTNRYATYCHENGIKNYKLKVTYDCAVIANGIQFSGFPDLTPLITGVLDIFCLLTLSIFRCYKIKWRRMSRTNMLRTQALAIISFVCICDIIYSIAADDYPYLANFLRPVAVLIFSSSIRGTMKQVMFNARDSIAVIMTIFIYIGFATIIAYYLFRGTIQGYQNFTTLGETAY